MTPARHVIPGTTYLITRRCVQRQFLLSPSTEEIHAAFLFCLAYAATTYDFEIHAMAVLGNHYHLVATDTLGCLPDFMQWLNRNAACAINFERRRWGSLWENEGYSAVDLIEPGDVLAKILYTLANPVEAALVPHGNHWPGLRSEPEDIGTREFKAKRPEFFDSQKTIPDEATLRLTKPPQFASMSDEEFQELLRQRYDAHEQVIRARLRAEGRKFLGVRRIRMQDPNKSPSSREERRGLNPRIACKRKWPRIAAIAELKRFRKEYREALLEYLAGDHDVIFPAGTWKMRVLFKVRCHSPP